MRLFIAIDIPDGVRAAIGELIDSLRETCRHASWVRLAGLHVTLKFIGETPSAKLDKLKIALQNLPPRAHIALHFGELGFFPNLRRPRVLWAGVKAGPDLAALAAEIENSLSPVEERQEEDQKFTPHLTLARFKDFPNVTALRAAIEKAGSLNFGDTIATEFHLYESVLKPGGAEYTRLATFSLSGGITD